MSGHSKWSQIKRKKELKDKQKGKIFSKVSRLITLAVMQGGGIPDPEHNIKLRLAIEQAKMINMPKTNIQHAVEKATGPDKKMITEIYYEGFGPGATAFLIHVTTDNTNRSLSEIRNTLERYGGKLGVRGSTLYLFTKRLLITIEKKEINEKEVFSFAEEVKALDIDQDGNFYFVEIPFETLNIYKELQARYPRVTAEIDFKPKTTFAIAGKDEIIKIRDLSEALESLDDVQNVFTNADILDKST